MKRTHYNQDLKLKIVQKYLKGISSRQLCAEYEIPKSTLLSAKGYNVKAAVRLSIALGGFPNYSSFFINPSLLTILQYVLFYPLAYLHSLSSLEIRFGNLCQRAIDTSV